MGGTCAMQQATFLKWMPMECVCIKEASDSGHLTEVVLPLHEMSSVVDHKFTNL